MDNTGNKADAGFVCDNSTSATLLRGAISGMLCAQHSCTIVVAHIVCVPVLLQQLRRISIDRDMVSLKRTSWSHLHMRQVLGLCGATFRAAQKLHSHRVSMSSSYITHILALLRIAIRLQLIRYIVAQCNRESCVRVRTISNFHSQIAQW